MVSAVGGIDVEGRGGLSWTPNMHAKRRLSPTQRRQYEAGFFSVWKGSWGRMPFIRVVGTWLIFVPVMAIGGLLCGLFLWGTLAEPASEAGALVLLMGIGAGGGLAALGAREVFRCTRVYLLLREYDHVDEPEDSGAREREGTTEARRDNQTE